jgi:hypothetical protein
MPAIERDEEEMTDATEGTRLHAAVATKTLDGLNEEQRQAVGLCLEELLRFGPDGWQYEVPVTAVDDDFELLIAGTVDAVKVEDERTILYDWKFGRDPVDEAPGNLQLMAYALAAYQKWGRPVTARIYQPRLRALTEAVYGPQDEARIVRLLTEIRERASEPGMVLRSGTHCSYCPAAKVCPEYARATSALVQTSTSDLLAPSTLAQYLQFAKMAPRWAANVRHHATQLLMSGVEIPGVRLRTKQGNRKFADEQGAYQIAMNNGITHEEFMAATKTSVAQVEEAFVRHWREAAEAKGEKLTIKDAKDRFMAEFGDEIERGSDSTVLDID